MPRSPSRDLSDRYTGNRKYFRRPEWLRRDRYLLALVAAILAGFWAVADVAAPKRTMYSYSHGPLANVHAAWDNDCAACHVGFSSSDFSMRSIFTTHERWKAMTCEKCHAGAPHNPNFTATGREFHAQCSNCHKDHAGREASLVKLADSSCTHCHANLPANTGTGKPKCADKVTGFTTDHPEFRPLTVPPDRTLKFSHSLHMTAGQAHVTGGKEAMTVARLRQFAGAAGVARYGKPGQADTDLISLDCASCHKLDSGAGTDAYDKLKASLNALGEPTRSVQPPRAAGATMLPINFESHCIACHPLRAPDGASSGFVISGFDVPHRKPLDQLTGELNAGYLRSLVTKDLPALTMPIGPGGMIDQPLAAPAKTIRDEATRLANTALPILSNSDAGCAKCHDVAASKITPLPNRTVWFESALFDHTPHKGATCMTCHPGTYAPQGQVLVEKEPVQILGIESCKACHSPLGTRVTLPDKTVISGGGVRSNCTDCHRYHNADHGLQGRGAAALFPAKPRDLAEFLHGK